jgi:DNA-binding CsgD family transcriptional regulator
MTVAGRPGRLIESAAGLRSPVLVGRERELDLMLAAATRPPALIVVQGEAGVGKTRLVEELLGRAEIGERRRYVGHCEPLGEPFPLGPVIEALRTATPDPSLLTPVAGALRPLLPELSPVLPTAPAPLGDRRAEQHRVFRAIRELLAALGAAVVVLEDLHWADDRTLELLRFLARRLPAGLVAVCTCRSEEFPRGGPLLGALRPSHALDVLDVSLQPLDKDGVRALACQILGIADVSEAFSDYLSARSGGLPFAVEEVLGLLRDRSDLAHRSGLWMRRELAGIAIPRPLSESILERLGRLRPAARRTVQAAAVLAAPCEEVTLLTVARVSEENAADALSEALGSGLLVALQDGRYGFRHVLARDAIEDGIPPPQRRRMHLRAARALEAAEPRPLVRLAHHHRLGGRTAQWLRYAEAAADGAVSLEDDATAYRLLEGALAVRGLAAATRGRLAVKLATHALDGLMHTEAIEMLRPLLDDPALPRERRGELRIWFARLLAQAGDGAAGDAEAARALQDLDESPALAARAMSRLARPWDWDIDRPIDEHLEWLDRATRTAARSRDSAVLTSVALERAITLLSVGHPGWRTAHDELAAHGTDAEDPGRRAVALNNLADAAIEVGRYRMARELVDEGLVLARNGHSRMAMCLRCTEMELDWVVGGWGALGERASRFVHEMEDWPDLQASGREVLGLFLLAQGEVRAARRMLEPLVTDFHGSLAVLSRVAVGLARIRLAEGSAEDAVREAARALDPIRRKQAWSWAAEAAPASVEALLAAGRTSDALDLTNRFARGLRRLDAPAACAALAVCRALLAEADGRPERAARAFLSAERAWLGLPRPYDAGRAREGAGRCLLKASPERGRQLLLDALDTFRGLGAAWDAARVRSALREGGALPPNPRGRKGYGAALSPREAEVARLAGEGMTNREIAATLFVAVRTVEQHLGSATRKLGVKSKRELRELVRRAPARFAAPSGEQ